MEQRKTIKCQACFAHAAEDVRIGERELSYGPDEVLVKVEYGGICGSDIHYYQHGRAGMSILKQPMVIGHEFVGIVAEAPAQSKLKVGQKVAVNPSKPCGVCEYCQSGEQNHCPSMRFMGSAQFFPHVNGGFSEYVAVTPAQCVPYSNSASPAVMAFSEPLAVAIHAVNLAGNLIGKKVLVTGAGPIGCLVIAAARCAGASEVVASDMSPRCRDLAMKMGASATFDPTKEDEFSRYQENKGYFHVAFEASGAESAIASTPLFIRPNGRCVQLGMGKSPVNYPVSAMLSKEINWLGSFRFIDEFNTSVKWLEEGRIDPRPLISGEFPLAEAEQALKIAADKNVSAKVLIRLSEG